MSAFLFFPLWMIFFVFLLVLTSVIVWVWALVDCLASRRPPIEKILWIFIILALNIIGALLYFIFSGGSTMVKKSKEKRLMRSKKNRMIAGVCGGIGEYAGIDPTVIRLLWVFFTFISVGAGILAYIVAWTIIPEK